MRSPSRARARSYAAAFFGETLAIHRRCNRLRSPHGAGLTEMKRASRLLPAKIRHSPCSDQVPSGGEAEVAMGTWRRTAWGIGAATAAVLAVALAGCGGGGQSGDGSGGGGAGPGRQPQPAAGAGVPDLRRHAPARSLAGDERRRLAVDHQRHARRRISARDAHLRRRQAGRRRRAALRRELALSRQSEDLDAHQVRRVRRTAGCSAATATQREGRIRRLVDDARTPRAVLLRHVHARAPGGARPADRQRRAAGRCSRSARTGTRPPWPRTFPSRSVRCTGYGHPTTRPMRTSIWARIPPSTFPRRGSPRSRCRPGGMTSSPRCCRRSSTRLRSRPSSMSTP